jgi:hypothetical protein
LASKLNYDFSMNKLPIFLKSIYLSVLFSSTLGLHAKEASAWGASLDHLISWSVYPLLKFTGPTTQTDNEKILIESFSEVGSGKLPDYPELMNKLFSHMYYTKDLEMRNNAFVRQLLDYYTPGTAAYEKLDEQQIYFLKHLQTMEDIYQRRIDSSEEDEQYPSIAELEALYKAQQEAEEEFSALSGS